MSHTVLPVIVVGAGPTGLTAATLLAQYGIECLVLDRWESIYPQPRAVHLDDEIYRVLARVGIAEEFAAISRPTRGLRLIAPDRRVLTELHRDVAAGRHGYPKANLFDQPELERLLRANLARYPGVTLRGNAEVTGLVQDGAGHVRVDLVDRTTGEAETLLADYVLGLRRGQQPHPHRHRLRRARPELRATLARRRHRHQGRPRRSGKVCTRSATPVARAPTCGSATPATAGSSASATTRPPRTSATRPGCAHCSRPGPATCRTIGSRSSAWPSTPSARRSPIAGATAGSSCSATPRTSPRRSSGRAWAPACATRPTCPGSSPACCTTRCRRACWRPTRPNAHRTPGR